MWGGGGGCGGCGGGGGRGGDGGSGAAMQKRLLNEPGVYRHVPPYYSLLQYHIITVHSQYLGSIKQQ